MVGGGGEREKRRKGGDNWVQEANGKERRGRGCLRCLMLEKSRINRTTEQ
jgi:hypothetical protein